MGAKKITARSGSKPRTARIKRYLLRALLISLVIFLAYEALTWPEIKSLARKNPKTTAFIELYKKQEKKAGRTPAVSWKWVAYSKISPHLKKAVLVSEDLNFFFHDGFDSYEIKDAMKDALKQGEIPRGASTITQQVAKNLALSPSRNPFRKLKEAILTLELEHYLSKKRILEIYLNIAEFGPGIYGAEAAAQYYFHKSAADLTETEAVSLAAGLPLPKYWHPGSKSKSYNYRVNLVMERMQKAAFLDKYLQ